MWFAIGFSSAVGIVHLLTEFPTRDPIGAATTDFDIADWRRRRKYPVHERKELRLFGIDCIRCIRDAVKQC